MKPGKQTIIIHILTKIPRKKGNQAKKFGQLIEYNMRNIFALLFRAFSIVFDFSRFHTEVSHLKDILRKNAFPIKLVDNCIKTFLNKKFFYTPVALTFEKKELFIALPYLGNLSLPIGTCLQNQRRI